MKTLKHISNIQEIPMSKLSTHYESYKFIQPKSEKAAFSSIQQFGQLAPIIVYPTVDKSFEIIDGFKRYRALKKLNAQSISASIVHLNSRTVKAAMLLLNQDTGTMSDLEEASIVQSLHTEDKLSQVEISKLLNRHKSWVSRRISLISRLDTEVINHIKLDLINISIGRELMRLPRGNQEKIMNIVIEQNLSCIETNKLVDGILSSKELNNNHIKQCINEIIANRSHKRNLPHKLKKTNTINAILSIIEKNISYVSNELSKNGFSCIPENERAKIDLFIDKIKKSFEILERTIDDLQKDARQ
jgi:ParB/RepB/Spo0J family partition protein